MSRAQPWASRTRTAVIAAMTTLAGMSIVGCAMPVIADGELEGTAADEVGVSEVGADEVGAADEVGGVSEGGADEVGGVGEVGARGEETALYRVEEGECLSAIARRLSFPGGWRALAKANGMRGDGIRAGAALRVPVGYVREAGLDPYVDFGLERYWRPREAGALVTCRDEHAQGACADVGETRVCVEAAEPAPGADREADGDCVDAVDGTIECGSEPGRVLVSYRDGVRREIVTLPKRGEPEVDVHRVDLDRDGRAEIVAAVPIEIRNHEGWQSVRVIVIDDRGDPAVSFDVAQWGEGSLIEAPGGGCDVLATSWEWVTHPIDGEGMYFVGRRLAWRDRAIVPRAGELLRRFRTYFHVTCDACEGWGPQTPAAWLSAGGASWWRELGDGSPVRARERGTIVGTTVVSGAIAFEVALAGRTVRLDPTASVYDDTRPRDVVPLSWVRLGPGGAQLPEAFVPDDLARARWIGREAIVEARGADDGGEPLHALWIDPP
jgi:hypothetical protein